MNAASYKLNVRVSYLSVADDNYAMTRFAILGMIALLVGADTPVHAQVPAAKISTSVQLRGECRQDRQRFCSTVVPGNTQLLDCYDAHRAELSKACANKLEAMLNGLEIAKRQEAWRAAHKPTPSP